MADENELSGDAAAYFESRGEKIPEQKEKPSETEAPEEAEAETDVLDDEQPQPGDKVEKVVPLRALTREREEGKKARAALQEAEKARAILEDRWNTILALQAQQTEQPPVDEDPEPDPNVDIFKHNAWLKRQLGKVTETIASRDKQAQDQTQAAENERRVWSHWNEVAQAEKAENPEFDEAVKFMSDMRTKQLKALASLHPAFKTDEGIVRQINSELRDIVITAANSQANPAKVIFGMAKEWGFQGKPADPASNPDAKAVEKLAKDIESETSLSSTGGSRPGGGQTAKDIADMSPEAFETWLSKNGAAGFKKLMQRGNA